MDRIVVSEYKDDQGKEVPAHTVEVMTAAEILERDKLNMKNNAENIRKRVLIQRNGNLPINEQHRS